MATRQTNQRTGRSFVAIAVLASLAVAQPLYSKLGEQAEFFVAHGASRTDLLLLCLVLSGLIPAALGGLAVATGILGPRTGRWALLALIATLAFLVVLPAFVLLGLSGLPSLLAAAGVAGLTALGYARTAFVRLVLLWLSPSILVFPLAFLLFSRASAIVLPPEYSGTTTGAGPAMNDVVFLVLDEFPLLSLLTPELDIDRERYPHFTRLAELSHWFPGASSGAEGTLVAVPSALTGLPPSRVQGKLPLTGNFPDNLFTHLGASHAIEARETATLLCPRAVCRGTPRSEPDTSLTRDLWIVWRHIVTPRPWSLELPPLANAWAGFGQPAPAPEPAAREAGLENALAVAEWAEQQDWYQRSAQFQAFLDALSPGSRPQLHYLHALLPHAPWSYLPDGRQYTFGGTGLAAGLEQDAAGIWRWTRDPWPVWQAWQRHLLQIEYIDGLIGRLLDRLAAQGMLDDTLLVVMGDHGGAFVPGEPRREVTEATLTDITAVPLFVKVPGQQRGVRHDLDARLEDVLPTVLDALGMSHTGTSLLSLDPDARRGPIEVWGRPGLVLTYSHAEHQQHLKGRARAKADLFGNGAGFYAIGPQPGLLGTEPAQPDGSPRIGEVRFSGRGLYRAVDPEANFIPRQIRGEVDIPDGPPRQALAIAVNGRIQATTWAIDGRFTALLPPGVLRPGPNVLDAYHISGDANRPSLARLAGPPTGDYRLSGPPGAEYIEAPDEHRIPIGGDSPGRVSSVPAEGGGLHYLSGQLDADPPPGASILAFQGEVLAGAQEIRSGEPSFSLPVYGAAGTGQIRVFAVSGGRDVALEFEYADSCRDAWLFREPGQAGASACGKAEASPLQRVDGGWRAELVFGEPGIATLLGSGWGSGGAGVRWTVGKSARLVIPLPREPLPLHFTARIKPYLAPPKLARQEVWLMANDEPAGHWVLDQPGFQAIEWTLEPGPRDVPAETLELRFLLPDAQAPRALGTGQDLRAIGLAFSRIDIRSDETEGR